MSLAPLSNEPRAPSRFALERDGAALLVIDVQDKLGAAMPADAWARVVKNTVILVEAAKTLGLPTFVTEQYPKGLGPTNAQVLAALPSEVEPIEKLVFSGGAVKALALKLFQSGRRQVIVCGMETHVCVFQTARDLAAGGYQPFVALDACSSRTSENHATGAGLMREAGATISSTEAIVYDLLGTAGTAEFKQLAPWLR
jgi:nicotinamidase-related amidase